MDELVGFAKYHKSSITLHLSIESFERLTRNIEKSHIVLELDARKLREVIERDRVITAVRYRGGSMP